MYVCMYVLVYVCMYVCMYVWVYAFQREREREREIEIERERDARTWPKKSYGICGEQTPSCVRGLPSPERVAMFVFLLSPSVINTQPFSRSAPMNRSH